MKRLTGRRDGRAYIVGCPDFALPKIAGLIIQKTVDRLAAIEDILGDEYGLDELREMVQAKREGRCVVLPCKPSDVTVYQLRNKKHARGVGVSPRHISCATVWAGGNYALHHQGQDDCLGRDLGKTWFLNEEDAEAALRREQDG